MRRLLHPFLTNLPTMSEFAGTTSAVTGFLLLLKGAGLTVLLSFGAILIGFVIALPVCLMRLSRTGALRRLGELYVSFFRGAPLLVQLLLIYNLLPLIGLEVPDAVAAIAGLSLCTAAYQAENLRGGFSGVPAASSRRPTCAGLSPLQTFRRIKLPIAVKLALAGDRQRGDLDPQGIVARLARRHRGIDRDSQNFAARDYRPLGWISPPRLHLSRDHLCWALGRRGAMRERSLRGGAPMSFDCSISAITARAAAARPHHHLVDGARRRARRRCDPRRPRRGRRRGRARHRDPRPISRCCAARPSWCSSSSSISAGRDSAHRSSRPAGLLGLSIYGSAYFAEMFRAGFEAMPRGHVEAAESVGFARADHPPHRRAGDDDAGAAARSINMRDLTVEGHGDPLHRHRAGAHLSGHGADRLEILRLRRGPHLCSPCLLGPRRAPARGASSRPAFAEYARLAKYRLMPQARRPGRQPPADHR